ncbi:MAG: DNA-binding protein [Lachnospiraceae bacterium]|nr:DNA-binding protein [Lachnospiraceae bacterium]
MERIVEQGLLYDYYGELLTDHQRKIYEDAVYHDLSLSEIAEGIGISRQGVHDLIRRCDRILQDYEEKLHLLEKSVSVRKKAEEISSLTEVRGEAADIDGVLERIHDLAQSLLEEF